MEKMISAFPKDLSEVSVETFEALFHVLSVLAVDKVENDVAKRLTTPPFLKRTQARFGAFPKVLWCIRHLSESQDMECSCFGPTLRTCCSLRCTGSEHGACRRFFWTPFCICICGKSWKAWWLTSCTGQSILSFGAGSRESSCRFLWKSWFWVEVDFSRWARPNCSLQARATSRE